MRFDDKQKVIRRSYFRLWSNNTIEKTTQFQIRSKKQKLVIYQTTSWNQIDLGLFSYFTRHGNLVDRTIKLFLYKLQLTVR
jgi:hypothetical protein